MSIQEQERRGTTAEHASFTGAVGELTVDTDLDHPIIHDGSRAGGFPIPNFSSQQLRKYSYDNSPGGTATAITVSTQINALAMTAGLRVSAKMASAAASGGTTLQWGSLSATTVKKWVNGAKADIEDDDWAADQIIDFDYDGTNWIAQLGGGGGAAWELVASTVVASAVATVEFDSVFELGYNYRLIGTNIRHATDGQHMRMRVSNDGNATQETTGYIYTTGQIDSAGSALDVGASSQSAVFVFLAIGNAANEMACFDMTIYDPMDTGSRFSCSYTGFYEKNTAVSYSVQGGGARDTLEAIDSLYFDTSSGNIASGSFALYRGRIT